MSSQVSDYVLDRLRQWGVHRAYGYQVTWEQRAMGGDPKFEGSRAIPDVPYARYAELLGLKGVYCDKPNKLGAAWDEALASDLPVVFEVTVDREIAPIPPHTMTAQARKTAKAMLHDPEKTGIAKRGLVQKAPEFVEKLPGRHHEEE
jgi:pyruvate dehydrogenase (quinone)